MALPAASGQFSAISEKDDLRSKVMSSCPDLNHRITVTGDERDPWRPPSPPGKASCALQKEVKSERILNISREGGSSSSLDSLSRCFCHLPHKKHDPLSPSFAGDTIRFMDPLRNPPSVFRIWPWAVRAAMGGSERKGVPAMFSKSNVETAIQPIHTGMG